MNVLFVTLDQFRADCLFGPRHATVRTPNLDRLAAEGVTFLRHYSQASPCGPGRAALYTGTYQMNNRVVFNGTPLDESLDNIAKAGRRAGFTPTLFGYTDQAIDPRQATGPDDPRLWTYEGVLPGFDVALDLTQEHDPWREWLASLGHDVPDTAEKALETEPDRPAEHGVSAFLTDTFLSWLGDQDDNWFAHLSYLRPHPPFNAAGKWATAYDSADVELPIAPIREGERHPSHDFALSIPYFCAPEDEAEMRHLVAQYYGMIGDADEQLGRVFDAITERGEWDDTIIVFSSDHGEQLGDHGLIQKLIFFEESYHVPCIIRDPSRPDSHGTTVDRFTENVDLMPTLCDLLKLDVPVACDGRPLTVFLDGEMPDDWRTAAHWEFDWRFFFISNEVPDWRSDRSLETFNVAASRGENEVYLQFGDGTSLCFDLAADPTWHTPVSDPSRVLAAAQEMLTWRSRHANRDMTGYLVQDGGVGRPPPGTPWT